MSNEIDKKFEEIADFIKIKKINDFNLFEMLEFETKIKSPYTKEI